MDPRFFGPDLWIYGVGFSLMPTGQGLGASCRGSWGAHLRRWRAVYLPRSQGFASQSYSTSLPWSCTSKGRNYPIWVREQGVGRNKSSEVAEVKSTMFTPACRWPRLWTCCMVEVETITPPIGLSLATSPPENTTLNQHFSVSDKNMMKTNIIFHYFGLALSLPWAWLHSGGQEHNILAPHSSKVFSNHTKRAFDQSGLQVRRWRSSLLHMYP